MKGLETRIAKLEKVVGLRDDVPCVIVRCFAGGELCGYRSMPHGPESVDITRQPEESEDALLERARAKVSPRGGMIVLRELRADFQDGES